MLNLHPIIQISATLLALYVLGLGVSRFRRLHLKQKTLFLWQRHVWMGTVSLLLFLLGMVVGLLMVKISWHGFFITGSHAQVSFLLLPLICIGLSSGWYMQKRRKKRILLPVLHGCVNVLLLLLVLYQGVSGWQVYNAYILGK